MNWLFVSVQGSLPVSLTLENWIAIPTQVAFALNCWGPCVVSPQPGQPPGLMEGAVGLHGPALAHV